MNSFKLRLFDVRQNQAFDDVISFSGADESGGFGIRANHARMMTVLSKGLSHFTQTSGEKQYIASPGAVLYFTDNTLTISSRHYIIDRDHRRVRELLEQEIQTEESQIHRLKDSLQHMEEAMLKRIWEMERLQ